MITKLAKSALLYSYAKAIVSIDDDNVSVEYKVDFIGDYLILELLTTKKDGLPFE